jgi:1,4-dihydroxy-2-naphthoate octaprenyltransferase
VAYTIPITLGAWAMLPLITAPLAIVRVRALVTAVSGPDFNGCLAATAQLMLLHGVLFAVGLSLS